MPGRKAASSSPSPRRSSGNGDAHQRILFRCAASTAIPADVSDFSPQASTLRPQMASAPSPRPSRSVPALPGPSPLPPFDPLHALSGCRLQDGPSPWMRKLLSPAFWRPWTLRTGPPAMPFPPGPYAPTAPALSPSLPLTPASPSWTACPGVPQHVRAAQRHGGRSPWTCRRLPACREPWPPVPEGHRAPWRARQHAPGPSAAPWDSYAGCPGSAQNAGAARWTFPWTRRAPGAVPATRAPLP